MPRQKGSVNKPKSIVDVVSANSDNEDLFLAELVRLKSFWANKASQLKKEGVNNERELEYSNAFRVLINTFTKGEDDEQPEKT